MRWSEVEEFAAGLPGVRVRRQDGLRHWRLHGRLVARQLDTDSLVIRVSFDLRPSLLAQFPGTFSVPARFEKHMMVVSNSPMPSRVPSNRPSKVLGLCSHMAD